MSLRRAALLLALLNAACGGDATGPGARDVQASALAGDAQFALPGNELAEPLQVVVIDAITEQPAEDVKVTWRVAQGSGATITTVSSTTDARGIASTRVRLGPQTGTYAFEASAENQVGNAARFEAQAIARPTLGGVSPSSARGGDTITLTGTNFNPQADYNAVLFDGIRGRVVSATATSVRAIVPTCVPSRTVNVQLWIGAVSSETSPLAATGTPGAALLLTPGEVRAFADPAALACLRLPGGLPAAKYVLIPQNVGTTYSAPMAFELATFAGTAPVSSPILAASILPAAERFEAGLRGQERDWVQAAAELRRSIRADVLQQVDPQVGDRRSFTVLNRDNEGVSITAEVKKVSQRAILYQDLDAPAGGFTTADFDRFAQLFDDPIYATNTSVFGNPSDIDANGKVVILLTPRVNALTARGENSVIAGYFYGCDLVSKSRCSKTNSGEIFYALVPDPQAKYGDIRRAPEVIRLVVPVLAHEFQHMINFGRRDRSLDALWLSEALAHTAEDIVGQVFEQRGDLTTARDFVRGNLARASRFLSVVPDISMIAEDEPGTLELRGGGWLLLRYLRAHYGGNALLEKLTGTTLSGTANVVAATGQSWAPVLGDFAVALYTSGALDMAGVPLHPRYTFGTMDVRARMIAEGYGYPLLVTPLPATDGVVADELPSSSSAFFVLNAPTSTTYAPINLVFAGRRGGPFGSTGQPQLVLLRIR